MRSKSGETIQSFLSNDRQRKIYEDLSKLIGPGPASFFKDACWLMENPEVLSSTSHLVGHLLREIDSALREVLKPVVEQEDARPEEPPPGRNRSARKEEIRAILRALKISEESRQARAWLEFSDPLARLAHRSGLEPPRPVHEVRDVWEKALDLLGILLEGIKDHSLAWFRVLDELLKKSKPDNEDIRRLRQEIPNALITRVYFFGRLQHPGWLEPLRKAGFFRSPPKAERDQERGTVRFPPWPEAWYLVSMARREPQVVAEIIREMPDTDNARAQYDLVAAVLAMPAELAVQLAGRVKDWARASYLRPYLPLPKKIAKLMVRLARAGRTAEALDIAEALLEPEKIYQEIIFGHGRGHDEERAAAPHPRNVDYLLAYEAIVSRCYPLVVRAVGLPALEKLCDLLERAIEHAYPFGEGSFIHRPAIEDRPEDGFGVLAIEDVLISGVRDAAELLVREERAPIEKVVEGLERRRDRIFRRIALHLIRVFRDRAGPLVAAYLTNRDLLDDPETEREYAMLMRECFGALSPADQQLILRRIEEGPGGGDVDREAWQWSRLAWIGPEHLPPDWRDRYQALVQKYGEPEHQEFPPYSRRAEPTGPKTPNELGTWPVDQLLEFLTTRMPSDQIPGKRIARLLLERLEGQRGEIPIDLRDTLWGILEALAGDPDPTPEDEQQSLGSNMDPANLSINTTRGLAMHAVIQYGLWVRRRLPSVRSLDDIPEVRSVLEARLDPEREPSLAVRAVYGWRFPKLLVLDERWARDHAARIFPVENEALFRSAWSAYVAAFMPSAHTLDILDVLYEQYQHAVDRIGSWRTGIPFRPDPDKQLAEHLMMFHSLGKLSLEDPLMAAFWEKAPDVLRWYAVGFVGNKLRQTKNKIHPEILSRLERLWERRLEIIERSPSPSEFAKEISAFGRWFASGKFDTGWAVVQLRQSLRFATDLDDCPGVLERLRETAKTHPVESVECLRRIADLDPECLYKECDRVKEILTAALAKPEAREEARKAISRLASRGLVEFKDLLNMR